MVVFSVPLESLKVKFTGLCAVVNSVTAFDLLTLSTLEVSFPEPPSLSVTLTKLLELLTCVCFSPFESDGMIVVITSVELLEDMFCDKVLFSELVVALYTVTVSLSAFIVTLSVLFSLEVSDFPESVTFSSAGLEALESDVSDTDGNLIGGGASNIGGGASEDRNKNVILLVYILLKHCLKSMLPVLLYCADDNVTIFFGFLLMRPLQHGLATKTPT